MKNKYLGFLVLATAAFVGGWLYAGNGSGGL